MRISEPRRVLQAVADHPWAILESKGRAIWALLEDRARGDARSDGEIQAAIRGRREKVVGQSSGILVLPIFGVLAHRMSSFEESSGGTSVERVSERIQAALDNESIGTIVLQIDSPGGSVYGIDELAQRIFEARGKTKIIAVCDPLMASAAYWIGSAADEVVITPSGQMGSIGVFSVHAEFSRMEDAAGIAVTVVRSGRFKAEANPHEPLSEDARAHLQETADDYYGRFVDAVARHRGVTPDAVRTGMGEGRVLTAERAVETGLADRVATLEEILSELGVTTATRPDSAAELERCLMPAAAEMPEVSIDDFLRIRARRGTPGRAPTMIAADELEIPHGPTGVESPTAASVTWPISQTEGGSISRSPTEQAPDPDAAESDEGNDDTADITAPSGQEDTMAPKTGTGPQDGAEKNTSDGVQVTRDESAVKRADEVIAICKEHGIPNRISEFVNGPMSVAQVRETIQAEAEANLQAMTSPGVDLTEAEAKRYSLTRAIMARADQGDNWDGFEREISDQIAKNLPKGYEQHGGFFVPTRRPARASTDAIGVRDLQVRRMRAAIQSDRSLPFASRLRLMSQVDQMQAALDSGTSTAGQELVFTEAGDFIDLLRARMKVAELGATILTGLQGPVAFPKQDGAGTFSWVEEDPASGVSDSDLTLTQVALNPKTGMSSTAYTRQLLAQNVIDVDMLVKNDLALITALGIDLAAIAGTGANNQPTGILNTANIGDVAIGAAGGAPTYAHMVDLETDVATANADIGSMAYLTTPGVRGKLKKTEEFATSNGRPVWTGGMEGEVNGYPAHVSTQVPSGLTKSSATGLHAILFGVWSQLMIGYWGAYELVVDPYSQKKKGLIELTSFQMAGLAVRHPASFSAVQDANPAA